MAKNIEFTIKIASSGDTYTVPTDKSILDVLYENRIGHPSMCKAGMCSKCLCTYLEGQVEHRDILPEQDIDRNTQLTICASRATSDLLVLDI